MNLESLKLSKKTTGVLEDAGWTVMELATASVSQLTTLGLTEREAVKVIGAAGRLVNEEKKVEAYRADVLSIIPPSPPGSPHRPSPPPPVYGPAASAAFPEDWLSGRAAPPPMAVRIRRIFDQAVRDYRVRGGGNA
jgi:hypothetical protein